MKKMKMILVILLMTFAVACGQRQTFDKVATFNAGFRFTPTGVIYMSLPSGGTTDWNTLLNKPLVFPPAEHNHDLLYKAITYVPDWSEITSKPVITDLTTIIEELGYLPIPDKTTAEIEALTMPAGKKALVSDTTTGDLKYYDGTKWVIIIMGQ